MASWPLATTSARRPYFLKDSQCPLLVDRVVLGYQDAGFCAGKVRIPLRGFFPFSMLLLPLWIRSELASVCIFGVGKTDDCPVTQVSGFFLFPLCRVQTVFQVQAEGFLFHQVLLLVHGPPFFQQSRTWPYRRYWLNYP